MLSVRYNMQRFVRTLDDHGIHREVTAFATTAFQELRAYLSAKYKCKQMLPGQARRAVLEV